jgi:hypothetical protein
MLAAAGVSRSDFGSERQGLVSRRNPRASKGAHSASAATAGVARYGGSPTRAWLAIAPSEMVVRQGAPARARRGLRCPSIRAPAAQTSVAPIARHANGVHADVVAHLERPRALGWLGSGFRPYRVRYTVLHGTFTSVLGAA